MRLLVDCDGVLADYVGDYLYEVNKLGDTSHEYHHIDEWELTDALKIPQDVKALADEKVMSPGFCAALIPSKNGRRYLDKWRAEGHKVYCVTAPFRGPYWLAERRDWLVKRMGFDRKEIVFCYDKEIVAGDVLIDDKVDNLLNWQKAWPGGEGILFGQPWNEKDERWKGFGAFKGKTKYESRWEKIDRFIGGLRI